MRAVDVKTLRDGDVVLVRGFVLLSENERAQMRVGTPQGWVAWVDLPDIVSIEPRPLAVGDRVNETGGGESISGEIRHTDEGWALVKWGPTHSSAVPLSRLVRA